MNDNNDIVVMAKREEKGISVSFSSKSGKTYELITGVIQVFDGDKEVFLRNRRPNAVGQMIIFNHVEYRLLVTIPDREFSLIIIPVRNRETDQRWLVKVHNQLLCEIE